MRSILQRKPLQNMTQSRLYILAVFAGILLIFAFYTTRATAADDYVYVFDIKGNVYYSHSSDTKEPSGKVRSMQILYPGTILEIMKDASISLTCPQCKTLTLTVGESPYIIDMTDFAKPGSTLQDAAKHFAAALKNFVYPESKQGRIIYPRVRGPEESSATSPKSILMQPAGIIIPVQPSVTFIWTPTDSIVSINIRESRSKTLIYAHEKIAANRIRINSGKFASGRSYTWFLKEEGRDRIFEENFTLLSADEKKNYLKTMEEIGSMVPVVVTQENRYRLQAGYLNSEHFNYDAWHWLDSHGISDQ